MGGREIEEKEAFKGSVLKALTHPTRRKILWLTLQGHRHPEELAKELGVARPTIEGHLAELEKVKLIERITDQVTGKVFVDITPPGRTLYLSVDGLLEDYGKGRVEELKPSCPPVSTPPPAPPMLEKHVWGQFLEGLANSIKRRPAEWVSFILFIIGIISGLYGYFKGLYLGGTFAFLASFIMVPLLYVFIIRPFFKAVKTKL